MTKQPKSYACPKCGEDQAIRHRLYSEWHECKKCRRMAIMAGLKRITDRNKFRNQYRRVAGKVLNGDYPTGWTTNEADGVYEDDGNLHVTKHGLHVVFGIGQDTPGREANNKMRAILSALGMKRKIGEHVLVEEECDGEGSITCSHGDHRCDNCDGTGYVPHFEPEGGAARGLSGNELGLPERKIAK